jgi:hypothetical protein
MNYISTNHQGGLCNTLFKFSAAISLSIDNNVDYLFSKEFLRPMSSECPKAGYDPDYSIYYDNIYRNLNFIKKLPNSYNPYYEKNFYFNPIEYQKGSNLVLFGYFQSEKYFKKNRDYIKKLFSPTEEIKKEILNKIPDVRNSISIHIRRGDYLKNPEYHPQQPKEYYEYATNLFGKDKNYLVFSDDLNGANDILDFLPNKTMVTLNKDYLDLYAISMCENNIISNSTFGWWGSYLNPNENKKIVAPKNWFGPNAQHNNVKDLFPEDWILF